LLILLSKIEERRKVQLTSKFSLKAQNHGAKTKIENITIALFHRLLFISSGETYPKQKISNSEKYFSIPTLNHHSSQFAKGILHFSNQFHVPLNYHSLALNYNTLFFCFCLKKVWLFMIGWREKGVMTTSTRVKLEKIDSVSYPIVFSITFYPFWALKAQFKLPYCLQDGNISGSVFPLLDYIPLSFTLGISISLPNLCLGFCLYAMAQLQFTLSIFTVVVWWNLTLSKGL
jgi:hypothetical protein